MKITKKENPRVVIYPEYFSWESENSIQAICKSIKKDVKRHVDGVNEAHIEWDKSEICSHCGLTWEADESGLPQCCAKAQEEWEEAFIKEIS